MVLGARRPVGFALGLLAAGAGVGLLLARAGAAALAAAEGFAETLAGRARRGGGAARRRAEAAGREVGRPTRCAGALDGATEEPGLRTRLEQADRMASLGTLAAGIAHELSNPVASVTANLGFIRDELERAAAGGPPGATPLELRQAVDDALSGTSRVRELIARLKQFAAPGQRSRGPVDLRAELGAALGLARHEIARRARLVVDLPDRLPAVVAGATELCQVFVSLLVNAAQAIPEGHAAAHEVRLAARSEAGRVTVEVRDTGAGVPPEALPRVFEPSFATGSGLGLSICRGLVNAAGGTIEIASGLGQGSTFRVVLPASPDVGSVPGATAPPPAARERARILVVDDEPLVGRAVSSALSDGHDVAVTTSAVEALGRLEAGERFDLVLCDLMMPGMTGMELEARIARGAPDMVDRLVFITGGAYTSAALAFLDAGRPYLDKPVDPAALRALVGDRLAAARRG